MLMTIGETKFPNKIPNLNQSLFRGVNNLEFKNPKTKKISETTKDQILTLSSFMSGNIATIKKK